MLDLDGVSCMFVCTCVCLCRVQQAVEKSRLFNSREGLFGRDLTEYDILGQINRAFEPFCTLWETASNWCVPSCPVFCVAPVSSLPLLSTVLSLLLAMTCVPTGVICSLVDPGSSGTARGCTIHS